MNPAEENLFNVKPPQVRVRIKDLERRVAEQDERLKRLEKWADRTDATFWDKLEAGRAEV